VSDARGSREDGMSERLPDWFLATSALTMDPHIGPDEQYRSGAADMLAVLRAHPEWLNVSPPVVPSANTQEDT
jgi:hypothetical protein